MSSPNVHKTEDLSLTANPKEPLFSPERFDWDTLTHRYAWIQAMQGVPQNPAYHAEGDVWIHTGMVVRALLDLPEWQALNAHERALLYAAAILHDVAKPVTTEFDDNGVPSSPRHARKGEPMARAILEHCGIQHYEDRETIAKLVRHHGLPLWFMDKKDVSRALVRASFDVRLDWVALLAEADVRGRICADQQNLLDTVALFRDTCREWECATAPRAFASDHARFMYFREETYPLTYTAFDDRTFTVTLMCGLPGSGKDTWIKKHQPDQPVVSLDALRRQLKVLPTENQSQVIDAGKATAREYLRAKQPFIWNATNFSTLVRGPLIDLFYEYGARIQIVVCHAPLLQILARNNRREGIEQVPSTVIENMLPRIEPPSLAECHSLYLTDFRR